MPDPYSVLGVKRDASADEIKRAFRKLAKIWHPDRNKDDPKAQSRFSQVNSAYEILGDAKKRQAFDRGEIDADGRPRASAGPGFSGGDFRGGDFRGGPGGFQFDFSAPPFGRGRTDPRDIFSDLFRKFETGGPQAQARSGPGVMPGGDIELSAQVALELVASGGTMRVDLPDARMVEVKIPVGLADGATMRLKGRGDASPLGGPHGDALLTLNYAPHPVFTPQGADLKVNVALPLRDAVLGGKLRVPTLSGELEVTVPAWTSGGKLLRLKGKGLPLKERQGDLLVALDLQLGPHDPEIEGFFRRRPA